MNKNYARNVWMPVTALLIVVAVSNSYAQALDDIQSKFTQYQANTVQEKLYLNTDRSAYMAGELIWCKLYDINAVNNKLMDAGKIAYAEVLDKDNNPVMQAKIAMDKGMGDGSFYIPVTINSGNYKIRVYTNWMRNFSADKYFEKNITIINSLKEVNFQTKETEAAYDIQFFPEGGNLVNGFNNKVAFRAVGSDGKGINFSGAIISTGNDTLMHFSPRKFGIGSFVLKPNASTSYKAVLKINGKAVIVPLPAAISSGYAMQLNENGAGQLKVTVNSNSTGSIYLVAHTRDQIAEAKTANLTNGEATFLIDKSKLGDGVSHITIFNADKEPVCERLYAKRPAGQQLNIQAVADKPVYASRNRVDINLQTPEMANMSVSVYRLDSLETADPQSIYSYLWLTSELKGNVESPDYYLNSNDDEALDNLMLTHGWSKYNWNDILQTNATTFKYLPEYEGHIITGKVTDPKTGTAAAQKRIFLTVPGKRVQLYNSVTDNDGTFFINTRDLLGTNEIVVQPRFEQDTLLKIQVNNPFSEKYTGQKLSAFVLQKDLYNSILTHSLSMQVQNLYSGEKIRQQYMPVIDTTGTFNGAQKTYLLDNYTRFTTMEEVLREYVHEVLVSKEKDQFHFRILNDDYYMDTNQPLMLFDDVLVYDQNKIIAADPLKVRKLDVVHAIYYHGTDKEYGVMSFTTYKGDLAGVEIDKHALVMDYEGLQLNRTFFSPVYESGGPADHMPDMRTLLYWSPNVNTDSNGKTIVSFYTSDQPGKYMGVIQGLSTTGKAGMQTVNFEVRAANP